MKKIKEFTYTLIRKSLILIMLLLISFGNLFAKGVLAEETSPETTVGSNAQVENSVDQTADTGNNSIQAEPSSSPEPSALPDSSLSPSPSPEPSAEPQSSPDPSPSPTGEPEPSPEPDTSIDNNAQVENNVESTADSGNNSISQPEESDDVTQVTEQEATTSASPASGVASLSASPSANLDSEEASDSAQVTTGDAISVVEAENSVNSTEVNSSVVNQTLNIFLSGDVDLSVVPYIIAQAVFAQNNQDSQVVNVAIFNGNNYAYLSNDIVSLANTGANSINGAEQATINTGDAYSVVSIVNKVNTTIVDSVIHIVTINIFGSVNGNIILPELEPDGQCCGEITQIDNQANVENNVSSSASSGQNEIVSAEGGTIQTGDASSSVNVINIVNKSLIGVLFRYLFINNFGSWNGNFLGWDDFLPAGGASLSLVSLNSNGGNGCPSCPQDIYLNNQATVSNNILSASNTGGNYIEGGDGSVKTGNAYSVVSLLNFVNTSIIRSIGFFGFVNIFGTLNGDVGGESQFQTQDEGEQESVPEEVVGNQNQEQTETQNSGESSREQGGQLEITNFAHNVGEYVLQGDTITFFVTVKNTGVGKVYGAKARISFILDGVDMGGATFSLGDIDPQKGVKLTTGLVLSKDIKPGSYIARVKVWGEVGEDGLVSDFADLTFLVGGGSMVALPTGGGFITPAQALEDGEILGRSVFQGGLTQEEKIRLMLVILVATYLLMRGVRERRKIALALIKSRIFIRTKSLALRSYFFSHFPPFL